MTNSRRVLSFAAALACALAAPALAGPPGPPQAAGPGGPGGPPQGGMQGPRPGGPQGGTQAGQPGGPQGGQQGRPPGAQPGGPQSGPRPGPGPKPNLHGLAQLLARTADANDDKEVTASEWETFVTSVTAEDGTIDLDALVAALPPPPRDPPPDAPPLAEVLGRALDRDDSGAVEPEELDALFGLLDRNGDGALNADDRPAGGGGAGPRPPKTDPHRLAALLARAADADESGDVTTEEWEAFVEAIDSDSDRVVDMDALVDLLPAPPREPPPGAPTPQEVLGTELDHDEDGSVEVEDLEWFLALLDRDDDGAISSDERRGAKPLRGKMRGAACALARAADEDDSGDVTADEWQAFLDGLEVNEDGEVSLDDLASKLPAPRRGPPPVSGDSAGADDNADTTRRDRALVRAFDRDGDGVITIDDLQTVFDQLDRDASGALEAPELRRR